MDVKLSLLWEINSIDVCVCIKSGGPSFFISLILHLYQHVVLFEIGGGPYSGGH
jgi:hypothetical protein